MSLKSASITPYTLENRCDFVLKITRLSLWYAWRQADRDDSLVEILSSRTPVFRLTEFWDGASHPSQADFPWDRSPFGQIARKLQALRGDPATTPERFEEAGLRLLLSHLEARMERDVLAWPWIPAGYTPYELPEEQVAGIFACEHRDDSDVLAMHITNSCMPDSPFRDMKARAAELLDLLNSAGARDPNLRFVGCNSWMNAFPPFLVLFPPEWVAEDRRGAAVGYGFNWWGQFVARDGRFHERNGVLMRQMGEFPYAARDGRCEIAVLREHLHRFMGK
jgi:hypothetical protein